MNSESRTLARPATLPETTGTASRKQSTADLALAQMAALPARLDDQQLARVEAYAAAPLPALPRTDETHMLRFIRTLDVMPRQPANQATGELKLELMLRMLGHLPAASLDWMVAEVMRRFTFYPSIKELLDLSAEWTRSDAGVRARSVAQRLARDERQARLDDTLRQLRTERCEQDWIDGLDERTVAIAEGQGLLWRCDDCGSFAQRSLWREWQAAA